MVGNTFVGPACRQYAWDTNWNAFLLDLNSKLFKVISTAPCHHTHIIYYYPPAGHVKVSIIALHHDHIYHIIIKVLKLIQLS